MIYYKKCKYCKNIFSYRLNNIEFDDGGHGSIRCPRCNKLNGKPFSNNVGICDLPSVIIGFILIIFIIIAISLSFL